MLGDLHAAEDLDLIDDLDEQGDWLPSEALHTDLRGLVSKKVGKCATNSPICARHTDAHRGQAEAAPRGSSGGALRSCCMTTGQHDSHEEALRECADRALKELLHRLPQSSDKSAAQRIRDDLAEAVRLLDKHPYMHVVLDGAGLIGTAAGHVAERRWDKARDDLVTARGRLLRARARLDALTQRGKP